MQRVAHTKALLGAHKPQGLRADALSRKVSASPALEALEVRACREEVSLVDVHDNVSATQELCQVRDDVGAVEIENINHLKARVRVSTVSCQGGACGALLRFCGLPARRVRPGAGLP